MEYIAQMYNIELKLAVFRHDLSFHKSSLSVLWPVTVSFLLDQVASGSSANVITEDSGSAEESLARNLP